MNPRILTLNGEVNEGSALSLILDLLSLDAQSKTEPITIYINSPGGSIVHGLAIYDVIHHIEAPVYTVCCGLAASMGAFLLSCGEKGHRYALPHSRILIHQPLIYANNGYLKSAHGIIRTAKSLEESRLQLETIMAENSSCSLETMHKACERDNWLSAQEAIDFGLIDSLIQD